VSGYNVDGSWDYYNPDDPACTANEDQVNAAAHERMRNARTFLLVSIGNDSDGSVCELTGVLSPDDETDGKDRESVMRMLADMLCRMWFEDTHPADGAMLVALMAIQLTSNFRGTMISVMAEKGLVE
jgi:hypothetical protein